jgi:hypothetical protein
MRVSSHRRGQPLRSQGTLRRPLAQAQVRMSSVAPDAPDLVQLSLLPQGLVCGSGPAIPALFAAWSTPTSLMFVIGATLGVAASLVGIVGIARVVHENVRLRTRYQHLPAGRWVYSKHRFGAAMFRLSVALLCASVVILLVSAFQGVGPARS